MMFVVLVCAVLAAEKPPGGELPTTEQIQFVETRDPNHWAFEPPAERPVPAVSNSKWPQSEVDHFILAKLEAAGLSPTSGR